uniref:Uncharacterized protein n=1 Tax=Desulfobacca acetoxidans TaxID=60893 RepID=A0A7C5ALZ4_9BACT
MAQNRIVFWALAALVAIFVATWVQAVPLGPEPQPPFIGIIRNHTKADLSIYSQNSQGTLIVPARSWIEYVVWDKNFDLVAYLEGKPFYALKMVVTPQAYAYMTKKYDFVAEIRVPEPEKAKKPAKKRRQSQKGKGKKPADPS